MVKKVISIATAFLMLFCMIPFAAFAETVVCPKCGESTLTTNQDISVSVGEQIGLPLSLKRAYCSNCHYAKYEYNILGIAGEQAYDDGDELHIINFLKNLKAELLGQNATAEQAPTGIGRKDLPGYASGDGIPNYDSNGELQIAVYPKLGSSLDLQDYPAEFRINYNYSTVFVSGLEVQCRSVSISNDSSVSVNYRYVFSAPVTGLYYIKNKQVYLSNKVDSDWKFHSYSVASGEYSSRLTSGSAGSVFGPVYSFSFYIRRMGYNTSAYTAYFHPIVLNVIPDTPTVKQQTNITINNNTWNGNIYTDSSTNLTYIYPQYTTINESGDTVTNISENPIIYNSETKQYYTYDSTTNNYYYITYEQPATPTPSPSPDPGTNPTPKPGDSGDISTPESGKPGSSSGSGQSWWDKLLDKIGNAVIDGLLGAVSAVLKLILKLFSTILGWIIWLVSQVLTLFPFLPPGLGALLIGGVVVCFVIGIIKFIRG